METQTALQTLTLSQFDDLVTQVAAIPSIQSTLLDATVGLVVFFSFWWILFPKLLLGDCWGWDCAFFWMDLSIMMLPNTTVRCTPDSVSDRSMNTMLPAQNWLAYRLNGSWGALYSTHLENTSQIYSIVLCMQACSHVLTSLSLFCHFILVVLFCWDILLEIHSLLSNQMSTTGVVMLNKSWRCIGFLPLLLSWILTDQMTSPTHNQIWVVLTKGNVYRSCDMHIYYDTFCIEYKTPKL